MAKQKINRLQITGYAFKARRNTNLSSANSGAINFVCDLEHWDYGNWYDPIGGVATAPVSGIYHFTAYAFVETVTTTRAFFSASGSAVTTGTNPNGTARAIERGRDGTQTRVNRIEGAWEVYMAAGETFGVTLWTDAVNQLNSEDSWFAGHLVMAV